MTKSGCGCQARGRGAGRQATRLILKVLPDLSILPKIRVTFRGVPAIKMIVF